MIDNLPKMSTSGVHIGVRVLAFIPFLPSFLMTIHVGLNVIITLLPWKPSSRCRAMHACSVVSDFQDHIYVCA